ATSKAPDALLVLVGPDFGALSSLETLTRKLGLCSRVIFAGLANHEFVHSAYKQATVTVVPSSYESFSMVALESAAAGCPVIISSSVGVAPLFRSINGMVVEPATQPLAQLLARILTNDAFRNQETEKL